MSNYSYPAPPPPAAAQPGKAPQGRNRRSGRSQKRKKKGRAGFSFAITWWQGGILMLLVFALLFSAFSARQASLSIEELMAKRESQQKEQQQEISRHQVKYREWIEYYAAVYQIDPAFVAAIIKRESDYDPRAISYAGAMGLMQFMPDSFEWIAPKFGISADDMEAIYDPENAIKMGCYLLSYITKKYDGDPILTACAYHAGWGNVDSWLKKYSTDGKTLLLSQIPMDDTRYYAGKVLNAYAIYQQYYY